MIVKYTKPLTDQQLDRRDYRDAYEISVSNDSPDSVALSFWDGEPEDNTLTRNFNHVFMIKDAIRLAYEAGKRGEELGFQETEVEI